jgi:hypothetical protein
MAGRVPFDRLCQAAGLAAPVAEYRFAPPRRWRFDWAWLEQRLALEVQGGLFTGGRHSRGPALLREHEKLNRAAVLGWRVCFVVPAQVTNGEAVLIVEQALALGASLPLPATDTTRR